MIKILRNNEYHRILNKIQELQIKTGSIAYDVRQLQDESRFTLLTGEREWVNNGNFYPGYYRDEKKSYTLQHVLSHVLQHLGLDLVHVPGSSTPAALALEKAKKK